MWIEIKNPNQSTNKSNSGVHWEHQQNGIIGISVAHLPPETWIWTTIYTWKYYGAGGGGGGNEEMLGKGSKLPNVRWEVPGT